MIDKKKKPESNYWKDLNEWQENQYNPGHYTGGKIPPIFRSPTSKKAMGYIFLTLGSAHVILGLLILLGVSVTSNRISGSMPILVLGTLQLLVSKRFLRKK